MSDLNAIQITVGDIGHLLRAIDDHIFHMGPIDDQEVREPIHRLNAMLRAAITMADKASSEISALPASMFHEE